MDAARELLEQHWLGNELYVAYLSATDQFHRTDQTAAQLFRSIADLVTAFSNESTIFGDIVTAFKSLYQGRNAGVLEKEQLDALFSLYEKMHFTNFVTAVVQLASVQAVIDRAKDDFDFAVENLKQKLSARAQKLSDCQQLHDQHQKALKKAAKDTKKLTGAETSGAVVELQHELDRSVGELRTLSKIVLDATQDFISSYTDWFDSLLALHLKLKCSLRLVAVDDVGSKPISDIESAVNALAESISSKVASARHSETVLHLDQTMPVDRCLEHPLILAHYRSFMKEQMAEEALNFLLSTVEFRNTDDSQERSTLAKAMFAEFLAPGAPKEVNLSGPIVEAISKGLEAANPDLFKDAERSVIYTLQTDTWRRFLSSSQFQSLQRRMRALQEAATPRAIRTKSNRGQDQSKSLQLHSQVSASPSSSNSLIESVLSAPPSSVLACGSTEIELPENIARQELLLLSENIRRSLNEETSSDIIFSIGAESRQFFAHRFILEARCPLLLRAESSTSAASGSKSEIALPSVTSRAFKFFLEYIYTGTLPALTTDVLAELAGLAEVVHLPHLEELCGTLAVARLGTHDLAARMNQIFPTVPAPHSDDYPKYEAMLALMASRANEIFGAEVPDDKDEEHPFYDLYKGHILKLLERDDLVIDSEFQLLEFVMNWATRHTHPHTRTQEIKLLIDSIRFMQMSADELRLKVEPLGVVSDALLLEAYRYKSTGVSNNTAQARPRKYRVSSKKTAVKSTVPKARVLGAVADALATVPPALSNSTESSANDDISSTQEPAVAATVAISKAADHDAEETQAAAPRERSWSLFTKKPEPVDSKKDASPKKDVKESPRDKEKDKEKEKEKEKKKGIRSLFKRTSEFLSGTKVDKKDKKVSDSKEPAPTERDSKRLSSEFRVTKVDYGGDGREHQLSLAIEEKEQPEAPSTAAHSAVEAVRDNTAASTEVSAETRIASDGANADVALVDAILNEVQSEMTVPGTNTTSTEEDEDDVASKPSTTSTEHTAPSGSMEDLSAVEQWLSQPLKGTQTQPKATPIATKAPAKDHLHDIELLLEETAAIIPAETPNPEHTRPTKPSLADIEKLLEDTSIQPTTSTPASNPNSNPDLSDVLNLLKQT